MNCIFIILNAFINYALELILSIFNVTTLLEQIFLN